MRACSTMLVPLFVLSPRSELHSRLQHRRQRAGAGGIAFSRTRQRAGPVGTSTRLSAIPIDSLLETPFPGGPPPGPARTRAWPRWSIGWDRDRGRAGLRGCHCHRRWEEREGQDYRGFRPVSIPDADPTGPHPRQHRPGTGGRPASSRSRGPGATARRRRRR